MENVLFDIHLAEATISDNYRDFRSEEKKQELYAGIFKKHGITQEQFDTSLVWYGRNLDKFTIVYDNLTKRYAALAENINAEIELQQKQAAALSDSNRVHVWNGTAPVILTSLPGKNMVDFNLNLDTIQLLPKEYYEFAFNVLGIPDSTITPLVTLGIIFPDTVFVKRKTITDNGLFTISLPPLDSITNNPTHLFGSIHIPPQKGNVKIVIYDISILRKKEQEKHYTY